ncbi:hypothetical protein SASPL_108569 [Salvia splendens]|uniref:Uncharacterized protein n=1 Tax=Salvia splendens TaxID=180675 RepID=A0A8X9A8C2_SALSN|nr:hypothetical protein SASPL_108569 [Salvia splendens]
MVDYVPGIRSINTRDFISYLHDTELEIIHDIIFQAFDAVKSADFILCITVEELEAETISALRQRQPFYAIDQITNRKLVVDDWRVGINLCEGEHINKKEVAEKIEFVMNEKKSAEWRKEIEKVRCTLEKAVTVNGSSERNFDGFVERVTKFLGEALSTATQQLMQEQLIMYLV